MKSTVLFILLGKHLLSFSWRCYFPDTVRTAVFLTTERWFCLLSVILVVTLPSVFFLKAHFSHSLPSLRHVWPLSSHFVTVVLRIHVKLHGLMFNHVPQEIGKIIKVVKSDSSCLFWLRSQFLKNQRRPQGSHMLKHKKIRESVYVLTQME